jgi:hypothetical protein
MISIFKVTRINLMERRVQSTLSPSSITNQTVRLNINPNQETSNISNVNIIQNFRNLGHHTMPEIGPSTRVQLSRSEVRERNLDFFNDIDSNSGSNIRYNVNNVNDFVNNNNSNNVDVNNEIVDNSIGFADQLREESMRHLNNSSSFLEESNRTLQNVFTFGDYRTLLLTAGAIGATGLLSFIIYKSFSSNNTGITNANSNVSIPQDNGIRIRVSGEIGIGTVDVNTGSGSDNGGNLNVLKRIGKKCVGAIVNLFKG